MELTINNITKQYGNVTVLDDVSYRFTPGIYGILGANGAGKTTLFRIICGLMRANCGNIQYDHKDIALQAEYYRSILGFLPQDFRYYPDFTGLNFMMYIASLKGLNGKIAKKRCLDLLIQVGLDDVKNKKIRKYSGGMKQRLGIAQAMINNPEILILDEPTVGLDPKERVKFRKLISSFASEKIVLLSTHIVSDIEYIADEIIILKKGRIENTGTIGNKILYLFPINNLNVQNILGILYSKDAFFFHSFFINIGFIFIFQLLIRVGMQLYCFIYIKHWKF